MSTTLDLVARAHRCGRAGQPVYAVDVNNDAAPGPAKNIATLTATNVPSPSQALAQTEINVNGVVDLVAHKVLQYPDQDHVGNGDDVTYQVWVENRGNLDTSGGVTLWDVIPTYLTYANTSQSYTSGDQTVRAPLRMFLLADAQAPTC